jgi:hypothetical protein
VARRLIAAMPTKPSAREVPTERDPRASATRNVADHYGFTTSKFLESSPIKPMTTDSASRFDWQVRAAPEPHAGRCSWLVIGLCTSAELSGPKVTSAKRRFLTSS